MNASIRLSLVAGLALLALAACQTAEQAPEATTAEEPIAEHTAEAPAAPSPDEGRLTTENEFRAAVAGMTIVWEHGSATIHEDGTVTGTVAGQELTGTWSWQGEFYCRSIKISNITVPDDCQVLILSGDELIVIGDRGMGDSNVFQLEAAE